MTEPGRQPLRRPRGLQWKTHASRLLAVLCIPAVLTIAACHEHAYGPDGRYAGVSPVSLTPAKSSLSKTARKKYRRTAAASSARAAKTARATKVAAAKKSDPAGETEEKVKVAAAVNESSVGAAEAAPTDLATPARIDDWSSAVAKELARGCRSGDPGDAAALEACRQLTFANPRLRKAVPPIALWGRQREPEKQTISDGGHTDLSSDVLLGLYLPMFMFDGSSRVTRNDIDRLYRVELGATFRSRLAAGDFPEPLWHDGEQWKALQRTTAVVLWMTPEPLGIKAVEWLADNADAAGGEKVVAPPRSFDGKWTWTDDAGAMQPKITQFVGLLQTENPFLEKLSASYYELAQSLDDGKCSSCHVPSNPNGMKRLVLLHTPVHAAGEVKRLIKSVDSGSMPVDAQNATPVPLTADVKAKLLASAREFDALIDKAKAWEKKHAQKSAAASP